MSTLRNTDPQQRIRGEPLARRVARMLSMAVSSESFRRNWLDYAAVAFLLVLVLIVFRHFLYGSEYPAGWDVFSILLPVEAFDANSRSFSVYEDTSFGQTVPITLGHVLAFINNVFGSGPTLLRLAFLASGVGVAMSMFALARSWTNSTSAAAIASLIYLLNPQTLSKYSSGQYFLATSLAIYPLLLLFTSRALESPSWKSISYVAVLLNILLFLRGDPIVYGGVLVSLYVIYHIVSNRKTISFAWSATVVSAIVVAFVVTSAWFWFPLLTVGSELTDQRFTIGTVRTTTLGYVDSIVGHSIIYSYWFWDGLFSLRNSEFLTGDRLQLALITVPATAFTALLLRSVPKYGFLLVLLVVTVLLAMGPRGVTGPLYEWSFEHFETVRLLHEPNRFLMITWLAYSLAAGAGLIALARYASTLLDATAPRVGVPQYALAGIVPVVLLVPWLIAVAPASLAGYRTWEVPGYVQEPYDVLPEHEVSGTKVISVPFGYERSFTSEGWMQHDAGTQGNVLGDFKMVRYVSEPTREGLLSRLIANYFGQGEPGELASFLGSVGVGYIVNQSYPPTQPFPPPELGGSLPVGDRWTYSQQEFVDTLPGLERVWAGEQPDEILLAGTSWEGGALARLNRVPTRQVVPVNRAPEIYSNLEALPAFSIVPEAVLFVGDLMELSRLERSDDFRVEQSVFISASDILRARGPQELLNWIARADAIVFSNSDLTQLALDFSEPQEASFGKLPDGWIYSPNNTFGNWSPVVQNVLIGTPGASLLGARVDLSDLREDTAELWIEVFNGPQHSTVSAHQAENLIGSISTWASEPTGYGWRRVGEIDRSSLGRFVDIELSVEESGTGDAALIRRAVLVDKGRVDQSAVFLSGAIGESGMDIHVKVDGSGIARFAGPSNLLSEALVREAGMTPDWQAGSPATTVTAAADTSFEISANRDIALIATANFDRPQDWSRADVLFVDFKGLGSGELLNLFVSSSLDETNRSTYSFLDTTDDWRTVAVPLSRPDDSRGSLDLSSVRRVSLDNPSVMLEGQIHFRELIPANVPSTKEVRLPRGEYEVEFEPSGGDDTGSFRILSETSTWLTYKGLSESVVQLDWQAGNERVGSRRVVEASGLVSHEISLDRDRPNAVVATASPSTASDWSGQSQFSIRFKGQGTDEQLNVFVYSGDPGENRHIFSFWDESEEWREVTFQLDDPAQVNGTPDLARVNSVVIDNPSIQLTGELRLGELRTGAFGSGTEIVSVSASSGPTQLVTDGLLRFRTDGSNPVTGLSLRRPGPRPNAEAALVTPEIVQYSPTKYRVLLGASSGYLVFQDAYSDRWKLTADSGETVSPVPGNFIVNVYPVGPDELGWADVEFEGQSLQDAAFTITASAIALAVILKAGLTLHTRRTGFSWSLDMLLARLSAGRPFNRQPSPSPVEPSSSDDAKPGTTGGYSASREQ